MSSIIEVPDKTDQRTLERVRPNGDLIMAIVGLHKMGDQIAYWSATGAIWEARKNARGVTRRAQGRDSDLGGMIHDEILRTFPELAPIVALHLSDVEGVPMHALANGRYFIGQGDRAATAWLWRVALEDLPAFENLSTFTDDTAAFVDAQRDRWRAESVAAYALLQGVER